MARVSGARRPHPPAPKLPLPHRCPTCRPPHPALLPRFHLTFDRNYAELKRENEHLRNTLHGYDADDGDTWRRDALQRLQDQLTELRAQGGVQRVVEAEEKLAREMMKVQVGLLIAAG